VKSPPVKKRNLRSVLFRKQTGILLLSFLLIVGLIVILTDSQQLKQSTTAKPVSAPQWYAKEVDHLQMNELGLPIRVAFTREMVHDEQDHTTRLAQPRLVLYRANQEPWQVSAQQGIVYHGDALNEINQLDLLDDVLLEQQVSSKKPLQAKTEVFTLYPLLNEGRTDKQVTITQSAQLLQGTGMIVYFDKEQMNLLSEVITRYDIPN